MSAGAQAERLRIDGVKAGSRRGGRDKVPHLAAGIRSGVNKIIHTAYQRGHAVGLRVRVGQCYRSRVGYIGRAAVGHYRASGDKRGYRRGSIHLQSFCLRGLIIAGFVHAEV